MSATFAPHVIAWQRTHGRHDLPWQQTRDAYAIWISEIMLQQTQVSTVIPFYQRFMARFPTVQALADGALDDVLACWSGLGYYSRARNLHRTARIVCDEHAGLFPDDIDAVRALPGIGRSTAAAIVAFAYGKRHAILDGNVKRVLARACAVRGYPGEAAVARALWQAAEERLPLQDIEAYTQGLMDLGATICTRRAPQCGVCPVRGECLAWHEGSVPEIPAPRPRKARPQRSTIVVIAEHDGALLIERRPGSGIWGGLWCLPEVASDADLVRVCAERYGAEVRLAERLQPVAHAFTHFDLSIVPQRVHVERVHPFAAEPATAWLPMREVMALGLPAPVRRILETLETRQASLPLTPTGA